MKDKDFPQEVIFLIGLPGSGKTSFVEKYYRQTHVILSTDAFIEQLAQVEGKTYNELWKDNVKEAETLMYDILENAIQEGLPIVWDQTNLNIKTRKRKMDMFPPEYNKFAVAFETPFETILERNVSRQFYGRGIPKNILESMKASYQPPAMEEGFNGILFYGKEKVNA